LDTNGVQGFEADLSDHHSLHEAMEGVDVVYNLASPMPGDGEDFMTPNSEGVLNLLEAASEAGVKTFVQLSTLDVFGFGSRTLSESSPLRPTTDYQVAKAESERLLQEFARRGGTPQVVVIRAARGVGSRDETLVLPLLKMVEAGTVVLPGAQLMSFSHPKDIAQAMYRAASGNATTGRTFLIKSFDATPEEFARGLATAVGKSIEVRRQGVFSAPRLPKYTVDQLRASLKIEDHPGWKELGYAPQYDLKATCEEVAAWYRKEPWITESA
jgi:nucleoside-diphosphate-sugar epimerase